MNGKVVSFRMRPEEVERLLRACKRFKTNVSTIAKEGVAIRLKELRGAVTICSKRSDSRGSTPEKRKTEDQS